MKKFENKKIIKKLLKIKNLLNEAGKREIFFEHKLTVANYEILKIIDEENTQTISELQYFFSDSLPSLTQKTNKLQELGYIQKKKKDKTDPRKNILKITKTGKKAVDRVEKKIEIVSSFIFKKYSQKEKENFLKILEDLEDKLKKKIN